MFFDRSGTLRKCSTQQLSFEWSAHIKISSTVSEVRITLYSIINDTKRNYCLKCLISLQYFNTDAKS